MKSNDNKSPAAKAQRSGVNWIRVCLNNIAIEQKAEAAKKRKQKRENQKKEGNEMQKLFNFGKALELLKQGKRVARSEWNGNGMYAFYQKGYPLGIPCNKQTAEASGLKEGELFKCNPYFQLKTATGNFQMWQPNTLDILSEDWYIVLD